MPVAKVFPPSGMLPEGALPVTDFSCHILRQPGKMLGNDGAPSASYSKSHLYSFVADASIGNMFQQHKLCRICTLSLILLAGNKFFKILNRSF